MPLNASELILHEDQSIYHLKLLPEDLAETVITVGDPTRVPQVSKYFDRIELRKGNREFITHTGYLGTRRISVISTGIGTDNIDIVLNELDALVNIDFDSRSVRQRLTPLQIIRIGTSGALQPEIPPDTLLLNEYALGLDGLLHYYRHPGPWFPKIEAEFIKHLEWPRELASPYVVSADPLLVKHLDSDQLLRGFTATGTGFYGPQARQLRLEAAVTGMMEKLKGFRYEGLKITNFEMETSAIYGLSQLMGHRAISLNCILANRDTGVFSRDPGKAVENLIEYTLDKLISA